MFKKKILLLILISMLFLACSKNKKLAEAATNGNLTEVKKLIEKGADINYSNSKRNTALMKVCYFAEHTKYFNIAKELIDLGADVNKGSIPSNYTPLDQAVKFNNYKLTKLLLDNYADPNITFKGCYEGRTVLMTATSAKKPNRLASYELVKLLIDNGADIELEDASGKTALDYALQTGRKDLIKLLK